MWKDVDWEKDEWCLPAIDREKIESLFYDKKKLKAMKAAAAGGGGEEDDAAAAAAAKKKEEVCLLDSKRAYNGSVIMSQFRGDPKEIVAGIQRWSDDRLPPNAVDALLKIVPTKEEVELLNAYDGPESHLRKLEQFMKKLAAIPRLEGRLKAFKFKHQWENNENEVKVGLDTLEGACTEIMQSESLKRILKMILAIGNYMNAGKNQVKRKNKKKEKKKKKKKKSN